MGKSLLATAWKFIKARRSRMPCALWDGDGAVDMVCM